MADIIAVVEPNEALTVAVSEGTYVLNTSTNLANPAVVESISRIGDVDTTILNNGAVLVYKTTTKKWTSTTTLADQNMEGGEF
jgi:hypothetical protein